jgi:hypothetical protein
MIITTDGSVGANGALKSPVLARRNGPSAILSSSLIFGSLPHRDNVIDDAAVGCVRKGYCWFIRLRRCILQDLALQTRSLLENEVVSMHK